MKQCTHSQEITSDTVSKHLIKVLVECDYFNGGPLYSYVIALLKNHTTKFQVQKYMGNIAKMSLKLSGV